MSSCFITITKSGMEGYILQKKRGIVVFDDDTKEMELFYIDDNGFLQIPKKQEDDIIRFEEITKKQVPRSIVDDESKHR